MAENRPKIGVALSGGAARGLAHVGALRALLENNVSIDCIAGTSAGSLVGGAYATGLSIDQVEDLGRKMRWRDVGRMTMSRFGVQSNARLEKFLRERLPITRFEDLSMPFAVVATELDTGAAVVMRDHGDIPFAIRASSAIPGWYLPVKDENGRRLVDGGLVAVVPVSIARSLGADIVIAVDVNAAGATFLGPPSSIIGVMLQSILTVARTASHYQHSLADHVIKPKIGHIRWDQMRRGPELIEAGYAAAMEIMPEILATIERASAARFREILTH